MKSVLPNSDPVPTPNSTALWWLCTTKYKPIWKKINPCSSTWRHFYANQRSSLTRATCHCFTGFAQKVLSMKLVSPKSENWLEYTGSAQYTENEISQCLHECQKKTALWVRRASLKKEKYKTSGYERNTVFASFCLSQQISPNCRQEVSWYCQ